MKTPQEFRSLLEKYAAGQCSPEEIKLVEDWYDNISTGEEQPRFPEPEYEEQLWNKVRPRTGSPKSRSSWLKIAASIAFFLSVSAALYFILTEETTPTGLAVAGADSGMLTEQYTNVSGHAKKIRLEDGSVITLQPASKILFPKRFNKFKREIELHGEAFFEIRRDTLRPFIVYSRDIVTKVLGTSFTVRALDSDPEVRVSVKTGKVSVSTKPRERSSAEQPVILTPNQEVVFNRQEEKIIKQLVEKPEIILAQPTLIEMQYRNTPVSEIFAAIELNYGIRIEYDSVKMQNCVLTTNMNEEGLLERIEIICKAIDATYTVADAVIRIEASGCN